LKEKGTPVGIRLERPADGVQGRALVVQLGFDFPDFLDADAVGLRLDAIAQVVLLHQLTGERTTATLGEDGLTADQFDPGFITVGRFTILADAHIAGSDAAYRATVIVEHLGGGEAGENFHAQFLGLFRQPAAQVAKTDDVVSIVMHLRRGRHSERTAGGQVLELVRLDEHVQGRAFFLPVGNQLGQRTRLDHGAGKDVSADLGAFFEDTDSEFTLLFLRQLRKSDSHGQSRRSGTDDDDVKIHCFSFHDFFRLIDYQLGCRRIIN